MGAGGLKTIRHCGKYYLYYMALDGDPKAASSDIVESIPTDPKDYQSKLKTCTYVCEATPYRYLHYCIGWLDPTRSTYAEMARVLESHVVTIWKRTSSTAARIAMRLERSSSTGSGSTSAGNSQSVVAGRALYYYWLLLWGSQ